MLSKQFTIFSDIQLLYYYIILRSSIIFLFLLERYISLDISLSCSFVFFPELFYDEVFKTLVMLLTITNKMTKMLLFLLFESFFLKNFKCICCRLISVINRFWLDLPLLFQLMFLPIFLPIFLGKDKNPQIFTNNWSLGWKE